MTYIWDYYSSLSIYVDMWIWVGMKMYVYIMIYVPWKPSVAGARFFLSLVRSGLGLCSAGRRPGYGSNMSVTEVTCPVIGRARPGVAPGGRRWMGPGVIGCPVYATETGQHRRGSVAMTFCWPLDRRAWCTHTGARAAEPGTVEDCESPICGKSQSRRGPAWRGLIIYVCCY